MLQACVPTPASKPCKVMPACSFIPASWQRTLPSSRQVHCLGSSSGGSGIIVKHPGILLQDQLKQVPQHDSIFMCQEQLLQILGVHHGAFFDILKLLSQRSSADTELLRNNSFEKRVFTKQPHSRTQAFETIPCRPR